MNGEQEKVKSKQGSEQRTVNVNRPNNRISNDEVGLGAARKDQKKEGLLLLLLLLVVQESRSRIPSSERDPEDGKVTKRRTRKLNPRRYSPSAQTENLRP